MVLAQPIRRGNVFVSNAPERFDVDPEENLLELWPLDAKQLLSEYEAKQSKFQTAPFDEHGEKLRFYPGGVTIWSGFPGSGKTTLLRQMACHLLLRGEKVFFASLEEHPNDLLMGIAGVAGSVPLGMTPPLAVIRQMLETYSETLRIWGHIGTASHRKLLATVRYLADQGITHAFVDSLMCMDIRNDDIEAQRQFAVLVASTARASGVHIHIVAHPKKPMQRDQGIDISDVAGAKEIGGIADNVIFIQRGESTGAGLVPMKIIVKKQRYWKGQWPEYEGVFMQNSRQFGRHADADCINYLG